MKKSIIRPVILLVIGLVIAVGSMTFLGPCVHEDGSAGACAQTAKAVCAAGCLLILLAAPTLWISGPGVRLGLAAASLCAAIQGLVFSAGLLPLCGMGTMRCRALMQPAMLILFSLALLVSAAGILSEGRAYRKAEK